MKANLSREYDIILLECLRLYDLGITQAEITRRTGVKKKFLAKLIAEYKMEELQK